MKIEITQSGVFNKDGQELTIGTVIECDGDQMPTYLIGKAVEADSKRVAITNPAENAIAEDLDEITALRAEYNDLTGGHADKRWKEDTLREKIEALKAEG